jgi:hypothetical protein
VKGKPGTTNSKKKERNKLKFERNVWHKNSMKGKKGIPY